MKSKRKINIDTGLFLEAKRIARERHYASVDEFITHLLERELDSMSGETPDPEVAKRLKGLGYIS